MNRGEYKEQAGHILHGKRLPTALYVHREWLAGVGGSLGTVLDQVGAHYQVSEEAEGRTPRSCQRRISC